jgi:hypothetical protein
MKLTVMSIRFKRSVNTPLEAGLIIEGHLGGTTIVDMMGRVVANPWYFVDDKEMDISWTPGEFRERTTGKKVVD